MQQAAKITPEKFDEVMRLIHVLKEHAIRRKDAVLWGQADTLYWRLIRA